MHFHSKLNTPDDCPGNTDQSIWKYNLSMSGADMSNTNQSGMTLQAGKTVNRRRFIRNTAAGTVAMTGILASANRVFSQDNVKIGLIGCGWYGMVNVKAAFKVGGVEVSAVCDVDSAHLQQTAGEIEKMQDFRPRNFKNYEDLLEVPGLQAVIIATPPQWHALPFIAALEKGLDIYCEKPLAYDIREGQAMVTAAEKHPQQVVQIGFQRRQSKAFRQVKQYIKEGNIGKVVQVGVQIHYRAQMQDPTPQDPPESLDWDHWCGPAPKLPYSPQIGHHSWRLEKEYGNGHLVDWGIHLIDATRVILDEQMPHSVQAAGGIYYHKGIITTPDILTAHFDFGRCPVVWRHRLWGAREYTPGISNGIFFYGEKGTVFTSDRQWQVIPKADDAEHQVFEAKADMGMLMMADFLEGVRTRKPPVCSPQDAFKSTASVQLAMIAYELKRQVQWNGSGKQIAGDPEAAGLLKRAYRAPWKHPYAG
jgi:predicted dehydrogenase